LYGDAPMTAKAANAGDFDAMSHERQLACLAELSRAAVARYDLPPAVSTELINLSENATYKVEDLKSGRRWALRVHRAGYHSDAAIASELAWLVDLRTSNVVTTPVPVAGLDGELIQKVGHPAMRAPRNVVLFDWERGVEPGVDEDLSGPFEILGEVTARMHRHVRDWSKPAYFERHTWDFETSLGERPHWGRWADGMGMDAGKRDLFRATVDLIGQRLEAFGKAHERFDLIHCDMRLANLLVDGPQVKVIDFDDCGFSWLMYDAATPMSFYEHLPEVPDLVRHWLAGYRRVIDLPQADEDEIPTFIMLRRLLLVAWIGSHSETGLAQEMGVRYTQETGPLCRDYLRRFG
jgi:Ser/Thr protein kinase RdoA (MazF antagonist)